MPSRSSWKGYLRLSLVSCPVYLSPATSRSERVSFHLLNPKTGNRISMRPHDAGTGEELERSELIHGYEFGKGRYVTVTADELEALQVESSKTIDLTRFVDERDVDPIYLDAPYYLAPEGRIGAETFQVIREAMEETSKAGIGRVVLSSREHPVLLTPHGRGMLLVTMRPAEEVRGPTFEDIEESKADKEMIELAKKIIEQKAGPFDPRELTGDRYQEALRELVARKIKGEKPVTPQAPAERGGNVINLMEALKRSLAQGAGKPPAPSKKRRERPAKTARAKRGRS